MNRIRIVIDETLLAVFGEIANEIQGNFEKS